MFGFLKDKLKNAVSKLSKDISEEAEEVTEEIERSVVPEVAQVQSPLTSPTPLSPAHTQAPEIRAQEITQAKKEEKKGFFSKLFKKKAEPQTPGSPPDEQQATEQQRVQHVPAPIEQVKQQVELRAVLATEETQEKKSFLEKIKETVISKRLSEDKFEDVFFDLELALMESNVAVAVIEKIKQDLKTRLVDQKLSRFEIETILLNTLKQSLNDVLSVAPIDLLTSIEDKRKQNQPYVIAFVGVNGSGKTTTIAKMAKYFQGHNLKPVLVAADTFRAAAIQQLEEHATKLGVKIIKHDYGSDPAAVAFDGIAYAKAKNADVVLIDTAGRLHSNTNLMDEMKKIMRVSNPDLKIFVGESITGNDCVEQAQQFNEAVTIDAIVLSKADVDDKGGAAISVSYVTGKPIIFFGSGQTYESLLPFDKEIVLQNLGLA